MRLTPRVLPALLALAVALPSVAAAQTATVTFNGAKYTGTNTTTATYNVPAGAVGPYQATIGAPFNKQFDVFCIDFDNSTPKGATYTARILTFNDVFTNSADLAALNKSLYAGVTASYLSATSMLTQLKQEAWLTQQFGSTPNTKWDEIQVAMWKGFSSSSIALASTQPAVPDPTVASWLTAATVGGNSGSFSDYRIILDNNAYGTGPATGYQQVTIFRVATVPEPSTYVLMGAGLLGLMVVARRRTGMQVA